MKKNWFLLLSAFLLILGCAKNTLVPTRPATTAAATAYAYETQWGDSQPLAGSGNTEFNQPHGVAVDGAGNVYVADTGNNRILKLNSTGQYLSQWGGLGTAAGFLSSPYGVAVDKAGFVYVTETGNNRVQKFTSNGVLVAQWGDSAPSAGSGSNDFNRPEGIAVDLWGNVYVADCGNSRVQELNAAGGFHQNWGSLGSATGQFYYPGWVAVDTLGNCYVSDTYNYRIEKCDNLGKVTNTLADCSALSPGSVCWWCVTSGPLGCLVEPNGNILVCDGGNSRLQEFSQDGTHLGQITLPVGNLFADNSGLVLDGSGHLYVADTNNNRIVVLRQP